MKQTNYAQGLAAFDTLPELKSQYNAINARLKQDLGEHKDVILNQAAALALGQPVDSKRLYNPHQYEHSGAEPSMRTMEIEYA